MFQLTRRAWLAAAASSAATACAHQSAAPDDELGGLDATATAAKIRGGEVSAAEVVEAAIRRAEAAEPRLNFLVTELFERARGQVVVGAPAGPFGGVPFLVKDLDDIAGVPTSAGSRLNEGRPPPKATDETVRAMEAAGLVALGKSTTPEYGLLATTEPLANGPTRNPWDPARSSGGSSGGSAAAVAAGVVPIAHASDGGGSIRIPAAFCGLFGLKASRGRVIGNNRTGPFDIAVDGCVSRTVRDSAGFYAAMERTGTSLPPIGLVTGPTKRKLRIGVLDRDARGKAPAPEVAEGLRVAAELCRNVGHAIEPASWPVNGEQLAQDFMNLWSLGAAGIIRGARRGLGRDPTDQELEPFTFALAARAAALKPEEIEAGGKRLVAAGQAYERGFAQYDVLLSPVMSIPPPEIGWFGPTVPYPLLLERLIDVVGYTPINNVSGGPAMSVPLHWTRGGLPVGLHFAAKIGDERTLLELAYQLEAAKPWAARRPAVRT